jgi:hypothetical protein
VRLDGVLLDDELAGDLGVREPACDEAEHLLLARRQLVEARRDRPRVARRPSTGDVDLGAAIAAARERAAAHDGTLRDRRANGIYHATASLPLVGARA